MADQLTPGVHTTSPAATGVALSAVITIGRRELARDGHVSDQTWDAVDALCEALIDQLPPDQPVRSGR